MKVYLAGPITNTEDAPEGFRTWRQALKHVMTSDGFVFLDPMDRDYRAALADLDANMTKLSGEIVAADRVAIQECDIVLANCYDQSVGTSMEIFYAHSLHKIVLAIVRNEDVRDKKLSPWLIWHTNAFCFDLEQAVAALYTFMDMYKTNSVKTAVTPAIWVPENGNLA